MFDFPTSTSFVFSADLYVNTIAMPMRGVRGGASGVGAAVLVEEVLYEVAV